MSEKLTPEDKELLLKVWGLKEGDFNNEEIVIAIKLGQL